MQYKISCVHLLRVGGDECIHLRRINRLASKVVKATTCFEGISTSVFRGTPERAVRGSGLIVPPGTSLSVLNIPDQNRDNLGHDQNICMWSAGDCLHLLQESNLSV